MPTVDDLAGEAADLDADDIAARARHQYRRTVSDMRRQVRDLNVVIDSLEDTVSTLEALRPTPPKTRVMQPRKRKRSGKLPASFVGLASDWHTCEIVKASQTNGLNEHNIEIGHERAWHWARGFVEMCKREQETCDIESVVLWLGGDFLVNDSMRYKAEKSVDMSPHEEARISRDLLANIIAFIRAELDVPRIIIPTSWGNHDRSTEKMITGHGGEYSYAQQIYRDLRAWFGMLDKSIEFNISESEWEITDVHGYRIMFHHGHYVGYGGGQAGLGHPMQKAIAAKRANFNFRTLCIGHYHQVGMYHGGSAFTNGSLVGANGYSSDMKFSAERPAQVAFLIDHQRQEVSNFFKIWCD